MNDLITVIRRIYRSSHSYPYPRTHSIVVLPSDRFSSNEELDNAMPTSSKPKRRPPLNRAISTIPESKSNESIITQASERRDDSLRAAIPKSSSDQSTSRKQPASSTNRIDSKLKHQSMDDRSVVIENKLAHNLATKKATSVTTASIRNSDSNNNGPPRSPLMSVAHSVRNRLTKLSNRFNRQDSNRSIRSSYSLSSMRQRSSDNDVSAVIGTAKKGARLNSSLFKKSASMETRPTPCSPTSESIKSSIPVRICSAATTNSLPTSNSNHKIHSKDDTTKMSSRTNKCTDLKGSECKKQHTLANASLLEAEESKNGSTDQKTEEKLSNDQSEVCNCISPTIEIVTSVGPKPIYSKNPPNITTPIRNTSIEPKPIYSKNPPNITTPIRNTSIEPKTIYSKNPPNVTTTIRNSTQPSISIQPKSRMNQETALSHTTKVNATISVKNSSKIKQWRMKTTAGKHSGVESADNEKSTTSQRKPPDDVKNEMNFVKKVERSFIPLISSTQKRADRLSSRRSASMPTPQSSAAPLAECESFRVENSPAIEMPPTSFDRATTNSPGRKRNLLIAKRVENGPETILEETTIVSTKDINSNLTTIHKERTDLNGNVEVTVAQTTISEHSQTSNNSNHNEGWALRSPAASSAETNRGLIDDEIKDQPLLIGGEFGPVDKRLTSSSTWRNQTEMCDGMHTGAVQKASQTSPLIGSLNMASSGYMTSSGILSSPINDTGSHSEADSIDEQLSNLTICNGASRARARHSTSVNNASVFVTNTQPGPSSYRKQHKIDEDVGNRLSPENAALFEAALHDVALLKNQLVQLQNAVNSYSGPDKLVSGDAEYVDRINVERLIRENDALRRELAEKDRIINSLRSTMPIN